MEHILLCHTIHTTGWAKTFKNFLKENWKKEQRQKKTRTKKQKNVERVGSFARAFLASDFFHFKILKIYRAKGWWGRPCRRVRACRRATTTSAWSRTCLKITPSHYIFFFNFLIKKPHPTIFQHHIIAGHQEHVESHQPPKAWREPPTHHQKQNFFKKLKKNFFIKKNRPPDHHHEDHQHILQRPPHEEQT